MVSERDMRVLSGIKHSRDRLIPYKNRDIFTIVRRAINVRKKRTKRKNPENAQIQYRNYEMFIIYGNISSLQITKRNKFELAEIAIAYAIISV